MSPPKPKPAQSLRHARRHVLRSLHTKLTSTQQASRPRALPDPTWFVRLVEKSIVKHVKDTLRSSNQDTKLLWSDIAVRRTYIRRFRHILGHVDDMYDVASRRAEAMVQNLMSPANSFLFV